MIYLVSENRQLFQSEHYEMISIEKSRLYIYEKKHKKVANFGKIILSHQIIIVNV